MIRDTMPPGVTLSPEQEAVVAHRGSDLQVIACAGSGKTESISRRVAALIAEGAAPDSIVAFTFTERAASELKDRITRRVAERMGEDFRDRLGPMFVGTIHAYCFRLLQDHVPQYGNYDVLDENRHAGFLSREYYRIGLSKLQARHWAPIRDFARTVDVIGNELIPANALAGTPLGECYSAYRQSLARHHFLTFGLIITLALEALSDREVLRRVRGPLRHLFVDEYQDINPAQERLIELLAVAPVELTVVGDDDQSIYQWRGSDVSNILQFRARRPNAVSIELDTNRRSRPAIVSAANAFAQSIPARLDKTMKSVRDAGVNEIVSWSAATDDAEAQTMAETIQRLKSSGYRYRDIAILFRSVRTSAPLLIEALRARDIPYTAAGRTGLFLQPEVAFIAEIYAWFVERDWRDEPYGEFRPADIDRIVAGINQVFGNGKPFHELREYLEDWRAFALRGSRPVNLVGDYYRLLHRIGVHQTDLSTPTGSARMGALARFSAVLADFEHVQRRGRQVDNDGELVFEAANDRGRDYFRALHNYLLHYARDAYEEFEGEESIDLDAVDILTIHQSKGLEWPVVFIPALVKGRFPSSRSGRPQQWLLTDDVFPPQTRQRYEGGDAEERRLFYVALTRTRDVAYLSGFERKTNRFQPSAYLVEVAHGAPAIADTLALPGPASPDAANEPETLDVSYSDLASFEDCGHRYRLNKALGFPDAPRIDLVLQHFENLLDLWSEPNHSGIESGTLGRSLGAIYRTLGNRFGKPSEAEEETDELLPHVTDDVTVSDVRERFSERDCLWDDVGKRFWIPRQTFAVPVPFFGERRARLKLNESAADAGYEVLGRRSAVDPTDLVDFLEELEAEFGDATLPELTQAEVISALRSLERTFVPGQHADDLPLLTRAGHLFRSSQLFEDDDDYHRPYIEPGAVPMVHPHVPARLSSQLGVSSLARVIDERLAGQPQVTQDAEQIRRCSRLQTTLRSVEFAAGLRRILRERLSGGEMPDTSWLGRIRLIPTLPFQIDLWLEHDGNERRIGSMEGSFFFDRHRDRVYVATDSADFVSDYLVRAIDRRLDGVLAHQSATLLRMVDADPNAIDRMLTRLRISRQRDDEPATASDDETPAEAAETMTFADNQDGYELFDDSEMSAFPDEDDDDHGSPPSTEVTDGRSANASVAEIIGDDGDLEEDEPAHPDVTSDQVGRHESTARTRSATTHHAPRQTKSDRFATHVVQVDDAKTSQSPEQVARRRRVESSGIDHVRRYEEAAGRTARPMAVNHEGYDLESCDGTGAVIRYIEVKSTMGQWDADGVGLTTPQFSCAQELAAAYWLYVVEFADTSEARIHRIQNPAGRSNRFYFDRGWIGVREEDL